MPWSNLPATQATDWSQLDFLNQFVEAYNERADVIIGVGGFPNWLTTVGELRVESVPLFEVGDDVSSANTISGQPSIGEIQSRLETLAHYFGAEDLFPVGEQEDIDYLTPYAGLYDLPSWREDAGIPAEGYTRKYPREIDDVGDDGTDGQRARHRGDAKIYDHTSGAWELSEDQSSPVDTVTDYGVLQAGDYIGPWLFNELQAGIQALDTVRFPVRNTRVFLTGDALTHYGTRRDGSYVAELAPDEPDLEGMAASAYAAASPDWSLDSDDALGGSSGLTDGGNKMVFTKQGPDQIIGGVRYSRHRCRSRLDELKLEFEGFWDNGLTRSITKLYFWPTGSDGDTSIFHDFGTGMADAWNDITGDYDPELPGTGEDWTASEQWIFDIDQTTMPPNPVATLGWFDTDYESVSYEMNYDAAPDRNAFAGYVQFSGFDYP